MDILARFNEIKSEKLNVDATRGKPSPKQVEISRGVLESLDSYKSDSGVDTLNYGGNDGLPEMKKLFADLLEVEPANIIVGGNASLQIMFDTVATMVFEGLWVSGKSKIICPSPGYDRHFAICEYFNLEMLTVPMTENGPDMAAVSQFAKDPDVVGIWCVPVFSNPQGYVYSAETVRELAQLPMANANFKILWDNAYTIHHFTGERPVLPNILTECEKNGYATRPIMFTSFSKITVPGGAVACMAAHPACLEIFRKRLNVQTIGPDKVNQLRHVRYFKDVKAIDAHMKKQAEIMRPKFELVIEAFEKYLPAVGAKFTTPSGGYFVAVETKEGKARRVVELCKEAGVLVTEAGAVFPYGKDPRDCHLRFAPSFLSMEELARAVEVFCLAVQLA